MSNLDNIVSNKNTSFSEDNNWPFRMLIIGPSRSGKTYLSDKNLFICERFTRTKI